MNEIASFEIADDAIEVRVGQESVWLSQEQMARPFERDRTVINRHLRDVLKEGELDREASCALFAQVQTEGPRTVTRPIKRYNLDAIGLAALSLLVAESKPADKDVLIRLIMNMLAGEDA